MTYIYDTPLDINTVTFERYGVTYHLEQTFKMGNRKFASFTAPGMDKILLVPQFANQYYQLDAKLKKLSKKKTFEDCVDYVTRHIDPDPKTDSEPDMDDDSVTVYFISCQYKDIRVRMNYKDGALVLSSEFEIVQNNLFGNGILVDTKQDDD